METMEIRQTSLSCAETARELRKALKAEFPGIKFSVRSRTYSGGASIDVGWMDGPLQAAVQAVCDGFRNADFDGMQDMKVYRDATLYAGEDGSFEEIRYGANYIFANRAVGAEREAAIEAELRAFVAGRGGTIAEDGKIEIEGGFVALDQYIGSETPGAFFVTDWWNDRCGTYVSELARRAGLIREA